MGDYWKDNNIEKPQSVVVCAAVRQEETGHIVAGARHFDNVMRMSLVDNEITSSFEEGFINQFGEFLTRKEAMEVAIKAGQKVDIERGCGGDAKTLYSEGLY